MGEFDVSLSPVRTETAKKADNKQVQTPKNETKEDNSKAIIVGLSALATVAIAAIALKKTGAGQKIIETVKKGAKNAADDVAKAAKDAADDVTNAAKNKADNVAKIVKDRADDAAIALQNGENYGKVKKEALKNLDHANKKVLKEKVLNPAQEAKHAAEVVQKNELIQSKKLSAEATKAMNNASQGLKNVTDTAVVNAKVQQGKAGVEAKQIVADEAKKLAEKTPTRKAIRRAAYRQNQAQQAIKQQANLEEKASKVVENLQESAAKKAENIAQMVQSPNYQAGVEKMQENSVQTAQRAVQRSANRSMNNPGFQRELAKLKDASPEKLRSILASPKSKAQEKKVAEYLLNNLAK